jgi:thiol-disulfide isomerase/thioredoxin
MPGRRELLALGAVGLAAAVAGALLGPLALQSTSDAGRLLAATYPDAAGRPHPLKAWLGKPVAFNFWATWCVPCLEEVPLLVEFDARFSSKGAQVVGICADQAVKMLEFAKTYRMAYPLLVADAGVFDLLRSLGNRAGALPYTIVLDRSGTIVHKRLGALKPGELEAVMAPMMG